MEIITIPKNEIINKNIERLLSPEFERGFTGYFEEDNEKIQSWVNMYYSNNGELSFEKKEGEVRFNINTTYLFKKNFFSNLFSKKDWIIDNVYYFEKDLGIVVKPEIKEIIQDTFDYVNKLSKKERKDYQRRQNAKRT